MKKSVGVIVALLVAVAASLALEHFALGGAVTVSCDFSESGRGFCQATPASTSFNYEWWANNASVGARNHYAVSAACGGRYGTVYVRVTDSNGNLIGSDSDRANCGGGR